MPEKAQKSLILIVIVTLIAVALTSVSSLIADIVAHQAARNERQWVQTGSADSDEVYESKSMLMTALTLAPNNPDYLLTMGRLNNWLFFVKDQSSDQSDMEVGFEYYREAVNLRPYWPYGWSELAVLKAQFERFDSEYNNAFAFAFKTGANEKQVGYNLANAALSGWTKLDEGQKKIALELFQHIIDTHPPARAAYLIEIARGNGAKDAVCEPVNISNLPDWVKNRCSR